MSLPYYNKTQVDQLLLGKSNVDHTHPQFAAIDERMTDFIERMAALTELINGINVNGNGSYYDKDDIDALLAGLADVTHTHNFSALQGTYDEEAAKTAIDELMVLSPNSTFTKMQLDGFPLGEVTFDMTELVGSAHVPTGKSISYDADVKISPSVAGLDVSVDYGLSFGTVAPAGEFPLPGGGSGYQSEPMFVVSTRIDQYGDLNGGDVVTPTVTSSGPVTLNSFDLYVDGKKAMTKAAGGMLVLNSDMSFTGVDVQGSGGFTAQSFSTPSLEALKEGITAIGTGALEIIESVSVKRFVYKFDETGRERVGFIADDTDSLLAGSDHDRMDIPNTVSVLASAIQELLVRSERTLEITLSLQTIGA